MTIPAPDTARILALDTATRATSVALSVPAGEPLELRDDPPRGHRPRHTARLMPMVAEILELGGVWWEDIDRIAVGVGPGTFTGLRVGVATARALAQARGIALTGVSTLRCLAANALSDGAPGGVGVVLAVLDARRGEVFAAGWRLRQRVNAPWDELLDPVLSPSAAAPEVLADIAAELGPSTLAIGEGAVEFRGALERSGASVPEDDSELHRVTSINHCRLARETREGLSAPVRPTYLRLPDAELALRAAGSK